MTVDCSNMFTKIKCCMHNTILKLGVNLVFVKWLSYFFKASINILDCTWFNGIHFCMEYNSLLTTAVAKPFPCITLIYQCTSVFICLGTYIYQTSFPFLSMAETNFPVTCIRISNCECFNYTLWYHFINPHL